MSTGGAICPDTGQDGDWNRGLRFGEGVPGNVDSDSGVVFGKFIRFVSTEF